MLERTAAVVSREGRKTFISSKRRVVGSRVCLAIS